MFKTRCAGHGWMKVPALVLILFSASLIPLVVATDARAQPSCVEIDLSLIENLGVDDGTCVIIELEGITNGEVLDIDIEVASDALDVMFFDSSSIQPYELGQSYLSHMESEPSTLSMLGSQSFHWKVPTSSTQKDWFIVVDNAPHDGDQNQGDQGGDRGFLSIDISATQEWYWTPYHNLLEISEGSNSSILSGDELSLDAGTQIVVTAWDMQSVGDVLLQTTQDNTDMNSGIPGDHHIAQAALLDIAGSESFTWTVDESHADTELFLTVKDDGEDGVDLKLSVRVELIPPLNPIISSNRIVADLGQSIDFNSLQTPNGLGQISSYRWYLDNSTTWFSSTSLAELECVSPQEHEIKLTISSVDGRSSSATRTVTCRDVLAPTASITSTLQQDSQMRYLLGVATKGQFYSDSTDDDTITSWQWLVDGESESVENNLEIEWSSIGEHVINLTVGDASGNSASIEKIVLVIDSTEPVIEESALSLPTQGETGEDLQFTAEASDSFDDESDLNFYWDLYPEVDSNQDSIADNDPDLVGKEVTHSFKETGDHTIVLTVSDSAGNSDRYVFQVTIEKASDEGSVFGVIAIIFLVLIITGVIAVFGERVWRTKEAEMMLVARGLSDAEAKARVSGIKSSIPFKPFTDAITFAGIDSGEQIISAEQQAALAKQEELDRLYGSGSGDQFATEVGQSAWAPRRVVATPIAQEAMSDLLGIQQQEPQEANIVAGGVEIPQLDEPITEEEDEPITEEEDEPITEEESTLLEGACSSCETPFEFDLPPDVNEAIIECPSCSQEQLFQR